MSKHAAGLHSRLQRTRGPGSAADRWLCCLGCLLLWLAKFWKGSAQWRGSRSPAGRSGSGSWLWSGSAEQPSWRPPPQCPRFDIPGLSTWGCALSVPSGHRLRKAAEEAQGLGRRLDRIHKLKKKKHSITGHLTVLHLVPQTTCLWFSHWEANTLLSRPRENSLSLRIHGSLPAAKPRRLRSSLSSCCC